MADDTVHPSTYLKKKNNKRCSLSTPKDTAELWLERRLWTLQTSKTLKDMNSDSFTLSLHNKLLWPNNSSSNTPASHNDQVTTSLSLGHAVHPPPQAQRITRSEREGEKKLCTKANPRAEKAAVGK